jgi:hypothetical protein
METASRAIKLLSDRYWTTFRRSGHGRELPVNAVANVNLGFLNIPTLARQPKAVICG